MSLLATPFTGTAIGVRAPQKLMRVVDHWTRKSGDAPCIAKLMGVEELSTAAVREALAEVNEVERCSDSWFGRCMARLAGDLRAGGSDLRRADTRCQAQHSESRA